MELNLFSFLILTPKAREEYIATYGKEICKRITKGSDTRLYSVNDYFVEVTTDAHNAELKAFRLFENTYMLPEFWKRELFILQT